MSCLLCTSSNQAEFPTAMMFHFSGQKSGQAPRLDFSENLECGAARFTIPETELTLLANV
jgi:hypothetical protein